MTNVRSVLQFEAQHGPTPSCGAMPPFATPKDIGELYLQPHGGRDLHGNRGLYFVFRLADCYCQNKCLFTIYGLWREIYVAYIYTTSYPRAYPTSGRLNP